MYFFFMMGMVLRTMIVNPTWETLISAVSAFPVPEAPVRARGEIIFYRQNINPPGVLAELPDFIAVLDRAGLRPFGIGYEFSAGTFSRPVPMPTELIYSIPSRFYGISDEMEETRVDEAQRSRLAHICTHHELDHLARLSLTGYGTLFSSADVMQFVSKLKVNDYSMGKIELGGIYQHEHQDPTLMYGLDRKIWVRSSNNDIPRFNQWLKSL